MAKKSSKQSEQLSQDELIRRADEVRQTLEDLLTEVKNLIEQTQELNRDMTQKPQSKRRTDK